MHSGAVCDMCMAHTCVVSRGPYPELRLPDAREVLFDDGSEEPWSLHLSPTAIDRMPLDRAGTLPAALIRVFRSFVSDVHTGEKA